MFRAEIIYHAVGPVRDNSTKVVRIKISFIIVAIIDGGWMTNHQVIPSTPIRFECQTSTCGATNVCIYIAL